ncbi:MAG: hypothetical protein WGN25_11445 [Candidatus Electrothrix sp. GW3-4]|uniref:hypothetical protein n=1 Tax=Candidatus Electrothrix sp. GW3-4 TaxID=3126740 RepID=UPI0030D518F4
MRTILCMMALFFLLTAGAAQAAWTDDFIRDYEAFGMDIAVKDALNNEVTPDEILTFIISSSEKFETKKGLKGLYCAGADRDAVREAANKLGITVQDLSVALEESIAECGDKLTLNDRDLFDGGSGQEPGMSDRDVIPSPEPVPEPELLEPPTRPQSASPSAP